MNASFAHSVAHSVIPLPHRSDNTFGQHVRTLRAARQVASLTPHRQANPASVYSKLWKKPLIT
jgi:hypothetical protein